ncbi:MAG: thioesterase domain-containing protein, partial [Candidatus Angelobacter sp.]
GNKLREYLKERLPEYMVPGVWVELKELPLTANGKVDRKALPEPDLSSSPEQYLAPRTPLESILADIWKDLLNVDHVGVKDNFFRCGGHSLLAVRLIVRISRALKVNLPLRTLFEGPTIEQQAALLETGAAVDTPESLVKIQSAGARRPLFCVHPYFGLAHCYQALSDLLGADQPLYGLQSQGLETGQAPLTTIPEMASSYLRAVRSIQPVGPYQFSGWSMGALIAFEMAQQAIAAGDEITFLGLFEGHADHTPRRKGSGVLNGNGERPLADNEFNHLIETIKTESSALENGSFSRIKEELTEHLAAAGSWSVIDNLSPEQIRRLWEVINLNRLATLSYRPQKYPGKVTLFRTPVSPGKDDSCGWASLARGGVKVFEIPGTHNQFMSHPSVMLIAEKLKECLLQCSEDKQTLAVSAGDELMHGPS